VHGRGDPDDGVPDSAKLCGDPPYPSGGPLYGTVLSCLDCHEPHGSLNETLIRREVNGGDTLTVNSITQAGCPKPADEYTKVMANLCNRCHNDDSEVAPAECPQNGWYKIHHKDSTDPTEWCNSDSPYPSRARGCVCHYHAPGGMGTRWGCDMFLGTGNDELTPITCTCCHYHGSIVTNCYYAPTTRRTF